MLNHWVKKHPIIRALLLISISLLVVACSTLSKDSDIERTSVRLAVAADFTNTAQQLAEDFTASTGIHVIIISGASGDLAARIRSGKRFDVFLSANTKFPRQLVAEQLALPEPVVYALGTIALFGHDRDLSVEGETLLSSETFDRLAVADPNNAPYGLASIQTLEALSLYSRLKKNLVFAENIAKALELIETRKADAGFVALPDLDTKQAARAWVVPSRLHKPIKQAAAVLSQTQDQELAFRWMHYLTSDSARTIIHNAGYRLPG